MLIHETKYDGWLKDFNREAEEVLAALSPASNQTLYQGFIREMTKRFPFIAAMQDGEAIQWLIPEVLNNGNSENDGCDYRWHRVMWNVPYWLYTVSPEEMDAQIAHMR